MTAALTPTTRALLAALAFGASLLCAGCGTDTLNAGKAETVIGDGLGARIGGKVSVSCPGGVKARKGGTFDCEATTPEGEKVTVAVVQEDDRGTITYTVR